MKWNYFAEYCATRAQPSVKSSEYLQTIGSKLLPDIMVMWTGRNEYLLVLSLYDMPHPFLLCYNNTITISLYTFFYPHKF